MPLGRRVHVEPVSRRRHMRHESDQRLVHLFLCVWLQRSWLFRRYQWMRTRFVYGRKNNACLWILQNHNIQAVGSHTIAFPVFKTTRCTRGWRQTTSSSSSGSYFFTILVIHTVVKGSLFLPPSFSLLLRLVHSIIRRIEQWLIRRCGFLFPWRACRVRLWGIRA